jgi:hypothetical protein
MKDEVCSSYDSLTSRIHKHEGLLREIRGGLGHTVLQVDLEQECDRLESLDAELRHSI